MKNDFYTYAYLREDGTPYYVGKGRKGRAFKHNDRIVSCPCRGRILFLKTNLTEEEAFRHEVYMIAVLGRKDLGTGILRNLTDGGEGTSGRVPTEEARNKIRQSLLNHPVSEKSRQRMSLAQKGKKLSPQTKQKMSASRTGTKSPNWGKKWFHDPSSQKNGMFTVGEQPEGWVIGVSEQCKQKNSESVKKARREGR
jgi:hypothetical protein